MENENKERTILNDEELKEVAGGKITNGLLIQMVKKIAQKQMVCVHVYNAVIVHG